MTNTVMIKNQMRMFLLAILLLHNRTGYTQNETVQDSISTTIQEPIKIKFDNKLSYKQFIIPALLVGYGVYALECDGLKDFNTEVKEEIYLEHPHGFMHVDDYSQYAPAVAVFGLQALGIKGKNNIKDELIIYALSVGISTAVVYPLKKTTKIWRPDHSAPNSFPSGHTAISFASAEFLRREYKDKSPWYGIAGYAVASGTGILRMYNNKHWFSDIAAGAGIGIASTTMAYWLHDKIKWGKKKKNTATIYPIYDSGVLGVGLVKNF